MMPEDQQRTEPLEQQLPPSVNNNNGLIDDEEETAHAVNDVIEVEPQPKKTLEQTEEASIWC